jgi:ACR3 family arsenite efflux pump ArsB
MNKATNRIKSEKQRLSGFGLFTEVVGWLQIVASPTLVGALLGVVLNMSIPGKVSLFVGLLPVLLGLIIGIIWATRVWRKKGTSRYMSEILSTPDIEDIGGR